MDLEQIAPEVEEVQMVDVDVEQMAADIEEAVENEAVVVSALDTVRGLLDMESIYSVLTVADNESITDNQLAAFRAGVTTSMVAAKGDVKTAFGIDVEKEYVDATVAYAKDIEGIKEFFKKIWAKIKAGLVKANAFFRKTFLKFLNMVSFRKGTIEKLQEDVAAETTGNEELKASKFGIVKKLAAPAAVAGKLSGDTIALDSAAITTMFEGATSNAMSVLAKASSEAGKAVVAAVKDIGPDMVPGDISDSIAKTLESIKSDDIKSLEKVDSASLKKFKKSKMVKIIRATGSKVYVFGVTEKNKIETGTVSIKADKVKTLTGLKSTIVIEALKLAETSNEDFKEIVNSAFEAYDDAEAVSEAFEGIKLPDNVTDEAKKNVKQVEAIGKNLVAASPWIAFNVSMGIYKAVGYSIGLGKAYLKEVKSSDDK